VPGTYSIAATPGRPTELAPRGAFVLPGHYTVRLDAAGRTIERPLDVVRDPRVTASAEELAVLFAFQAEVAEALHRAVDLAGQEVDGAGAIARRLAGLAADLESADARPTGGQRALFADTLGRLKALAGS
jgi:hypothetical protein